MNFSQLLNSLDELLYEIMSWLVFFPITLWRVIRRPITMMAYADTELAREEDEQFTDTLSPPLFLLVSLIVSHAIELAVVGDSPLIADRRGLAVLVEDDTSLLILRLVIFSVLPMIIATQLLIKRRGTLTRATLKLPFYSQCYVAAPFALLLGLGSTLMQLHQREATLVGASLAVVAIAWYGFVQSRWFAKMLGTGFWRGVGQASIAMILSWAFVMVVAALIA